MFNDLPKKERSFDFKEEGETTMMPYEGKFKVFAILNMGQKHQLEMEKTILQGDTKSPTLGLKGIANILAELRVRIIDAPDWWEDSNGGARIDDENIIIALYDKIIEQEHKWKDELRERTKKKAEESDPNFQKESSSE